MRQEVKEWASREIARLPKDESSYAKRDLITILVNRLLKRQVVIPSSVVDVLADRVGVTIEYMQRVLSWMPNVGLAFNGSKHYRMLVDSPVKHWSMCVWGPGTDEEEAEHVDTLERKHYRETTSVVPVPFQYVRLREQGRVCHLEPCDTERWSLALEHHLARKADQQEE